MRNGLSYSEAGKLGSLKSTVMWNLKKEANILEYNKNPKKCKNCNNNLEYNDRQKTFCNRSCSTSFNNKGTRRNGKEPGNCLNCDKKLLSSIAKFCSCECNNTFKKRKLKEVIIKEKSIESVSTGTGRRILKEIRGEKCEICGITKWNDKVVPLVMDHIDGNSDNNKLINLRLVCGNCDMQLPTYKSKNKGNGRAFRRKRYKAGKSY